MADYVAVYGSLRRGMQAESKMQRMEFVGQGEIHANLYALGWYPGIKIATGPAEDAKTVVDIFKLPEAEQLRKAILWDLDGYEGYSPEAPQNSLFVRKEMVAKGPNLLCYVYEYNYPVNRAPLVEGGDWVIFSKEKQT